MLRHYTLAQLADELGARLDGDAELLIQSLKPLHLAQASDVTFLSSEKQADKLSQSKAGALVLKEGMAGDFSGAKLYCADPYLAFAKLSALFDPRPQPKAGIHPSAVVAQSAQVADSAFIGANAVIGENVQIGHHVQIHPGVSIGDNSQVGEGSTLYANAVFYDNVRVGQRCIFHSCCVIGADGFGFAPTGGRWVKIHQIGGVVIGDDCEVGASSTIDRGAMEDTVLGNNVIIDDQVHIGHNVQVGDATAMAACTGISGSTKIGKNVIIAGAVGMNGHISIADGTHFNGGTIVTHGTEKAGHYASAIPMQEVRQWRRNVVRFSKLDEYVSRIKKLEKHVYTEK